MKKLLLSTLIATTLFAATTQADEVINTTARVYDDVTSYISQIHILDLNMKESQVDIFSLKMDKNGVFHDDTGKLYRLKNSYEVLARKNDTEVTTKIVNCSDARNIIFSDDDYYDGANYKQDYCDIQQVKNDGSEQDKKRMETTKFYSMQSEHLRAKYLMEGMKTSDTNNFQDCEPIAGYARFSVFSGYLTLGSSYGKRQEVTFTTDEYIAGRVKFKVIKKERLVYEVHDFQGHYVFIPQKV